MLCYRNGTDKYNCEKKVIDYFTHYINNLHHLKKIKYIITECLLGCNSTTHYETSTVFRWQTDTQIRTLHSNISIQLVITDLALKPQLLLLASDQMSDHESTHNKPNHLVAISCPNTEAARVAVDLTWLRIFVLSATITETATAVPAGITENCRPHTISPSSVNTETDMSLVCFVCQVEGLSITVIRKSRCDWQINGQVHFCQ